MTRISDKHPVANELRKAGFIPVPRLWIHADALPDLKRITDRFRTEVNEIRSKASENQEDLPVDYGPLPVASEVYDEHAS